LALLGEGNGLDASVPPSPASGTGSMGLYASLRIRGGLDDRKELERTTLDVLGNPGPPPAPPGPPTVPLPEWMTLELTLRLALTWSFLVLPSPRTIVLRSNISVGVISEGSISGVGLEVKGTLFLDAAGVGLTMPAH